MLKYWLGLLLLLNAAGLAWQWGALATWGWAPADHREPERLTQQLRPEAAVPVPAVPTASTATTATTVTSATTDATPAAPATAEPAAPR